MVNTAAQISRTCAVTRQSQLDCPSIQNGGNVRAHIALTLIFRDQVGCPGSSDDAAGASAKLTELIAELLLVGASTGARRRQRGT
jgi:hypothetical protein